MSTRIVRALPALLLAAVPAAAGEADVVDAEASYRGEGRYDFRVTLRHADAGWSHYANRWEVLGPDGEVLATRVLRHPHVAEQPFTRALPRVEIPEGVTEVRIRAHDSVHEYGGAETTLSLPPREE